MSLKDDKGPECISQGDAFDKGPKRAIEMNQQWFM